MPGGPILAVIVLDSDDIPTSSNLRFPMKTVVLAAGKETRYRPHTEGKPKGLVAVGGTPLIEDVGDVVAPRTSDGYRYPVALYRVNREWYELLVVESLGE